MKVLHIIRDLAEARAYSAAEAHLSQGHEVTLLLMQDAVLARPSFPGRVLASREDVMARGGDCPFPQVDYEEIVNLICDHDRVISW